MTMKHLFKYLITLLALVASVETKAQADELRKIYFLADTLNTAVENRYFEISTQSKVVSGYSFYCKCAPPYFSYPTFMYRNDRIKPKFFDEKPDVPYISWKQLSDLLATHGNAFPTFYRLIVVEKLPAGNYKMIDELKYVHQRNKIVQ